MTDGNATALAQGDGQPWRRRPDESAQAYAAFRAYLETDRAKRSIAAAYRAIKGMSDGATVKTPGYVGAWAARYDWTARVDAWDVHIDALAAVPHRAEIVHTRQNSAQLADRVIALVDAELAELETQGRKFQLRDNRSRTLADLADALEKATRTRLNALAEVD